MQWKVPRSVPAADGLQGCSEMDTSHVFSHKYITQEICIRINDICIVITLAVMSSLVILPLT